MWIKNSLGIFCMFGKRWQSKKDRMVNSETREIGRNYWFCLVSQTLRSWRQRLKSSESIWDVRPVCPAPREHASGPEMSAMFLHFHEDFSDASCSSWRVCVFFFLRTPNHKLPIYIFCFIILMIKTKNKKRSYQINICLKGQTIYFWWYGSFTLLIKKCNCPNSIFFLMIFMVLQNAFFEC